MVRKTMSSDRVGSQIRTDLLRSQRIGSYPFFPWESWGSFRPIVAIKRGNKVQPAPGGAGGGGTTARWNTTPRCPCCVGDGGTWCHGSSNRSFMVDTLSYFSFQPVLHDWCNKSRGMCYPVCGMMHIKEPLLII